MLTPINTASDKSTSIYLRQLFLARIELLKSNSIRMRFTIEYLNIAKDIIESLE